MSAMAMRSNAALASSAAVHPAYVADDPDVPAHPGFSGPLFKEGGGRWEPHWYVLPRNTNRLLCYDNERQARAAGAPRRVLQVVTVGDEVAEVAADSVGGGLAFDVWAKEASLQGRRRQEASRAPASLRRRPTGRLTR